MSTFVVLVVALVVPGILPALALVGPVATAPFLAALIGAALAAVSAGFEAAVAGTILEWYVPLVVAANAVAVLLYLAPRWRRADRSGPIPPWSTLATLLAVTACLAVPLIGLRNPMVGWDGNLIWLNHALMVSGGHHVLETSMRNPANYFSHADYPPLLPAAGALAFTFLGAGQTHVATVMTALLNACAVGVVGCGIAALGAGRGRRLTVVASVTGAALCIVNFSAAGNYGLDGYADLMWAAAATGAVVWGLMLPRSKQHLAVAWTCAVVASLTKNEGFAMALVVLGLISLRYRPTIRIRVRRVSPSVERAAVWVLARAGYVLIPAAPGLLWSALIHHWRLSQPLIDRYPGQSSTYRAALTLHGINRNVDIWPIALAVLLVGWHFLRQSRKQLGIGHPGWLWLSLLLSLSIILAIYTYGTIEIHSWIGSSLYRTTIFARLFLYADLAGWLVVAVGTPLPSRSKVSPAARTVLVAS